VQAHARGTAIDVIDLPIAPAMSARAEVRDVLTDSIQPDTAIDRIATNAVAAVANIVNRPIAEIAATMYRDSLPLGNLIADAFRAAGQADFGVLNNFATRADLRRGQATYGDVFEVQPFGNILYRLTATGASINRYLEKLVSARRPRGYLSGAVVVYDTTRAPGTRVTAVCLANRRAFLPDATYTIVINDFMLAGGSGLGFEAPTSATEALNTTDLDAFIAHLRAQTQPVQAPLGPRFTSGPAECAVVR
jgi:2',3'-cyclic-nucleotide 2'-phosphodiesterase (5'-nucleotidase family)